MYLREYWTKQPRGYNPLVDVEAISDEKTHAYCMLAPIDPPKIRPLRYSELTTMPSLPSTPRWYTCWVKAICDFRGYTTCDENHIRCICPWSFPQLHRFYPGVHPLTINTPGMTYIPAPLRAHRTPTDHPSTSWGGSWISLPSYSNPSRCMLNSASGTEMLWLSGQYCIDAASVTYDWPCSCRSLPPKDYPLTIRQRALQKIFGRVLTVIRSFDSPEQRKVFEYTFHYDGERYWFDTRLLAFLAHSRIPWKIRPSCEKFLRWSALRRVRDLQSVHRSCKTGTCLWDGHDEVCPWSGKLYCICMDMVEYWYDEWCAVGRRDGPYDVARLI